MTPLMKHLKEVLSNTDAFKNAYETTKKIDVRNIKK